MIGSNVCGKQESQRFARYFSCPQDRFLLVFRECLPRLSLACRDVSCCVGFWVLQFLTFYDRSIWKLGQKNPCQCAFKPRIDKQCGREHRICTRLCHYQNLHFQVHQVLPVVFHYFSFPVYLGKTLSRTPVSPSFHSLKGICSDSWQLLWGP